jgi:hypothetical protein
MPSYRIYMLDQTENISSVVEGDYGCGDAALAAAQELLARNALAEVWELARRLGQVRGT